LISVSVIIVNFNGKHLLASCLGSVAGQRFDSFEVLLVDNGSTDGSSEFVRENFPGVRLIASATNLGFAGGNNLGVEHARGELIVLLNNDTIVEEGWLEGLVAAVKPEGVAIAGSLVITDGIPSAYYERNGSINFLGHNIMRIFTHPENLFYAGGASLIYKKSILGRPFDPTYFAYGEDVYLGLRARRMGLRIVHTNASRVRHFGGGTAGHNPSRRLKMLQERNRLLNLFLFFSVWTIVRTLPYILANLLARLAGGLLSRRHSAFASMQAYLWIVCNIPLIGAKRKQLAPDFRVDDDAVLSWMTAKVTQGESAIGRVLNAIALTYCRLVGLRTIESLPEGSR
jgi:GT2 family glycosyltransferase